MERYELNMNIDITRRRPAPIVLQLMFTSRSAGCWTERGIKRQRRNLIWVILRIRTNRLNKIKLFPFPVYEDYYYRITSSMNNKMKCRAAVSHSADVSAGLNICCASHKRDRAVKNLKFNKFQWKMYITKEGSRVVHTLMTLAYDLSERIRGCWKNSKSAVKLGKHVAM